MDWPIMSEPLARQIEQVDIDYTTSRLGGMQQAAGNPLGIEIRQVGQTTAYLIAGWPDFWYGNRVLGFNPGDLAYLDELVALFESHKLPFRFEIIPGHLTDPLALQLSERGFYQAAFSAAVCGRPEVGIATSSAAVTVREIEMAELDLFLDLYEDGFGQTRLSSRDKQIARRWVEGDQAHLDLYLASVDDRPAGVAILYTTGKLGLLADASVLPQFRGRGCQTALVQARIRRAIEKKCALLTSFVEFGSTSHRNVARAGLQVAYTKALWYQRS